MPGFYKSKRTSVYLGDRLYLQLVEQLQTISKNNNDMVR